MHKSQGAIIDSGQVHRDYAMQDTRHGMSLAEYNRWLETPACPKTREPSDPLNNHPVYVPITLKEDYVPQIPEERIAFLYRTKLPRYTSKTVYWGVNVDGLLILHENRKAAMAAGLKEDALHFAVNNVKAYKGFIWVKAPGGTTKASINREQIERATLLASKIMGQV